MQEAYRYWTSLLERIENTEQLDAFISESKNLNDRNGHPNQVSVWLDQFIVSGKKIQNSEIFNELQIYFAISLFEADKLNEKSFDILEKQFKIIILIKELGYLCTF